MSETEASLAERLGESRIGARHDLVASRHLVRGEAVYILRDPLTLQTHELSLGDYQVFRSLRSERTLAEIFEELVDRNILGAEDDERFYSFVLSLHRSNLLQLPVSDEKRLYERFTKMREQKAKRAWMNLFFFKVSLFNPERFLTRTAHAVKPFFSKPAFLVWAVTVLAALAVAFRHGAELAQPLSQVLIAQNLPLLWITLIGLKVIHEFGHAYACKLFGGDVPEMGANFIVGTPLPYVDATAAWSFRRKRDRLIVSAAGMYVELFIAAIALMVWSVSGPGLLKAAAYNTAFLASVVTVGFNLNPLMKFDGYYLLSDALERPNLRQEASKRTGSFFKRWLLAIPAAPREGSRRGEAGLILFGIACALYKITLVLGISATIASKFFVLGVTLAALYAGSELWRALSTLWKLLFHSEETEGVRVRAGILGAVLLVAFPAGLVWVPVPHQVVSPAVLGAEHEHTLRAEVEGFLGEVIRTPGSKLTAGDPVARLEGNTDKLARLQTEGDLARATLLAEGLRGIDPITAQRESERVEHLTRQTAWYTDQETKCTLQASASGTLVEGPRSSEQGRWIRAGEPVAKIATGRRVVRTYLDEANLVKVGAQVGDPAVFRTIAAEGRSFTGQILVVQRAGTRQVDQPRLTHMGGGEIVIDPMTGEAETPLFEVVVALEDAGTLPHGCAGRVQFEGQKEPLGVVAERSLRRFMQRLKR